MNRPPAEPLIDVPALAARLGVSEQHVYRMVRENRVPFTRVDRLIRFEESELREWLATRRVPAVKK